MPQRKATRLRGPVRKHATRKVPNEPAIDAGLWLKCRDDEYSGYERAATSEGVEWVNHWAMLHLQNVATNGKSRRYPFEALSKPADHVQPPDRDETGVFIPSLSFRDRFENAATREGFGTVRD